jgi:hypothetical protein
MTKNSVISLFTDEISDLQKKIDLIKTLELGTLYELKGKGQRHTLVKIKSFNKLSVRFTVLANAEKVPWQARSKMDAYGDTWYYLILTSSYKLTAVPHTDLPLYLGWPWVSNELTNMLKKGMPKQVSLDEIYSNPDNQPTPKYMAKLKRLQAKALAGQ